MNYYDHASMQKLKLGPWAGLGTEAEEPVLEKRKRYAAERRRRTSGPLVQSGRWTGLFAWFCWFL